MYPPVAQNSPFLDFYFPVTLCLFYIMSYPILTCTPSLKRIHSCFQHADEIQIAMLTQPAGAHFGFPILAKLHPYGMLS